MVQVSDLYVAFMLSGFPDCLRGISAAVEPEMAAEDGIVHAEGISADPPCSYREVV